jgi:protein translocase SecG subunit
METLLIVLCMIASILLILVVLIQPGKSDMISGMGGFGGQFTNLLGVRQSRNILQNVTIGLAAFLIVASVLVNRLFLSPESTERAPVTQGAQVPVTSPGATMPTTVPPAQTAPAQQPKQAPATEQGK